MPAPARRLVSKACSASTIRYNASRWWRTAATGVRRRSHLLRLLGLDLFYRYHSGQFDRANQGQPAKDGGSWHHIGAKFTFERPFGSGSKWYGWAGVGPEYWWTEDYLTDDSGFGVFGELGVGYVLSRNLRLRAGVNVHGLDTDVTRELPVNDGQSRWLWVVAPVVEVELDF